MPTAKQLFAQGPKGVANLHYEHFIFSFPEDVFFTKAFEIEKALGVPVLGFIIDELFHYGIVQKEERGDSRIGPKMRKRMKEYLLKHPMPLPPHTTTKSAMKLRQEKGLEQLVRIGREMQFDILANTSEGLIMWNRRIGILAVAGTSFCYVYKASHSFRMDINFPIMGYFQLGGGDIPGQLMKAINGELQSAADKLSERRRSFMIRKKRRQDKINYIRNKQMTRSDQN
jgi:hypothetical protein